MKRLLFLAAALALVFAAGLLTQGLAAAPDGPAFETPNPAQPEVTCYSDPCAGWGSYRVSCTGSSYCVGLPDHVVCDGSTTYCPNPCAYNGICNYSCSYDPDCAPQCVDGAPCVDDDDCGPYGFCEIYYLQPLIERPPGICLCLY